MLSSVKCLFILSKNNQKQPKVPAFSSSQNWPEVGKGEYMGSMFLVNVLQLAKFGAVGR